MRIRPYFCQNGLVLPPSTCFRGQIKFWLRNAQHVPSPFSLGQKSKYVRPNLAHLNLLCAFRDLITTEMTIYVFKRRVTRVSITPVNLIGQSRLHNQPVWTNLNRSVGSLTA